MAIDRSADCRLNVAVSDDTLFMVTTHDPVPVHPEPDQPAKDEPAEGVAAKVTDAPAV